MNVHHLLIPTLSLLLLSGCASLSIPGVGKTKEVKPVEVVSKPVEKTPLNIPDPSPLKTREFEWIVITPANAEEIWKKLKEKDMDVVLIGLSDEGYQELAVTMAELRNYIATQRAIIIKYKDYYEKPKTNTTK